MKVLWQWYEKPFLKYFNVTLISTSHQRRLWLAKLHFSSLLLLIFNTFSSSLSLFFPSSLRTQSICSQSVACSMNCEKHEVGSGGRWCDKEHPRRWGNVTHQSTCMHTHRAATGTFLHTVLVFDGISSPFIKSVFLIVILSFCNIVHASYCMSRGITAQSCRAVLPSQYIYLCPCRSMSHNILISKSKSFFTQLFCIIKILQHWKQKTTNVIVYFNILEDLGDACCRSHTSCDKDTWVVTQLWYWYVCLSFVLLHKTSSWAAHCHLAHSGKAFPPPQQPVSLSHYVPVKTPSNERKQLHSLISSCVYTPAGGYEFAHMYAWSYTYRVSYRVTEMGGGGVRGKVEGRDVFLDPGTNERSLRGLSVSAWPELFTLIKCSRGWGWGAVRVDDRGTVKTEENLKRIYRIPSSKTQYDNRSWRLQGVDRHRKTHFTVHAAKTHGSASISMKETELEMQNVLKLSPCRADSINSETHWLPVWVCKYCLFNHEPN